MLHVYEFEIYEDDGGFIAQPFQFEGATYGTDFSEACEMAADWLKTTVDHYLIHNIPLPDPLLDHAPVHGGRSVLIAVEGDMGGIRRMTQAEAARKLGVTRGRVSQMIAKGLLESFEFDGRTWVTEDSVNARLKDKPKAGRPKKKIVA